MAAKQDLYAILGVPRDAERDAIRKAYRKLARTNHPDLNPGDDAAEERFKQISLAWEVLEDEERRRNYDEFGEVSLEVGFDAENARKARDAFGSRFGFEGAPGTSHGGQEFHFGDLDDLLGGFFRRGGEGGPGMRRRGQDLEAEIDLAFDDAVKGGEKPLSLRRQTPTGTVPETLNVRFPPGVDDGARLRLSGKGAPGSGGAPAGDLYVRVRVRPHRLFRRDGQNLEFDLPISVREATLGAQVEVPTLDGKVTLKVPAGTDSGARLRLRGKGVPSRRGGAPGDLFARIQIRVPRNLDDTARDAVGALAAFDDPDIRKELF